MTNTDATDSRAIWPHVGVVCLAVLAVAAMTRVSHPTLIGYGAGLFVFFSFVSALFDLIP